MGSGGMEAVPCWASPRTHSASKIPDSSPKSFIRVQIVVLASDLRNGDKIGLRAVIDEKRRSAMIQLTEKAIGKVREILDTQEPKPAGLRIAVVGGGCSGFSYSMAFENQPNMLDKTYNYEGLKVFVDQASMLYLEGAEVDYVETLEGSGFKFSNPNTK